MRNLCVYLFALTMLGISVWLQIQKWRARKTALTFGYINPDAMWREPSVHRIEKRLALAAWVIATGLFAVFANTRGTGWHVFWPTVIFAALFSPIVCLAVRVWRLRLQSWLAVAPVFRSILLWFGCLTLPVVYLILSGVPVHWQYPLLGLIGIIVILSSRARYVATNALNYPLVITLIALVLWAPIELRLVYGLPLPAYGGVQVARLLIVGLGMLFFLILAPLPDIGYSFRLTRREVATAAIGFVAFAGIAIPLGFFLGFIDWTPAGHPWYMGLGLAFVVYFVTAIPEELLFRGVFQSLLERHWPGENRVVFSLIVGALVFGLAHLDNPPAPNWKYVIMATIAGLSYGWVWQKTRKITAAAITHAAVDWIWIMFFLK